MNHDRQTGTTSQSSPASGVRKLTAMGMLVAFGIVFGDIGTSPLYVMKAIIRANKDFDPDYVLGAVSCIIWTLTIQTTLKYVLIALRADNKGEGGILALYSIVRKSRMKWIYLAAALGGATLIADGVITPAVTVTSAIEGLRSLSADIPVVPIVVAIIIGIFLVQNFGTGQIGRFFGPVMVVWFLSLGIFGILSIHWYPAILKAFNPWYAIMLLTRYPGWYLILGAVFLCTTGAEALYSDLGHCGRLNISFAWLAVKIMLILNYLGQGAWIITHHAQAIHPHVNPMYAIVPSSLLVPQIILATLAAVIASQALISGSFTIFSEAIGLRFWPMLRIKYPSAEKGQLFIPAINVFLFAGCLITVFYFRSSEAMEAAYGLAITITMLATTFLLSVYLRHRGVPMWIVSLFIVAFTIIEGAFLVANLFKFMHGGWYTILIAGILMAVMVIWYRGKMVKDTYRRYCSLPEYFGIISDISHDREIPKYASNLVFINHSDNALRVESKLLYSIVNKQPKRADHYWLIRIEHDDSPDTLAYEVEHIEQELIYCVAIRIGYLVEPKLTLYLRQIVEDLVSENKLSLTSRYPSLRQHGIPGEFRFVMINRIFSRASECRRGERMLMILFSRLSRLARTDVEALGLDVCNVTEENVPLILSGGPERRISPVLRDTAATGHPRQEQP